MEKQPEKNAPRELFAWTMYDWANSAYSLVVATAVFPIYYYGTVGKTVTLVGTSVPAESARAYSISIAYILVILLNPLLGGAADALGLKKAFLMTACAVGATACACLFFFTADTPLLGLGLFVVATTSFAISEGFYNAFLPEIATPDRFDSLSARGFSLGYVGSSILLMLSLAAIFMHEKLGITEGNATRLAFVATGVWWAGFGGYTFYWLRNRPAKNTGKKNIRALTDGFIELFFAAKQLRRNKLAGKFLGVFFCYNMGLQTSLNVASDFGKRELNLDATNLIIAILLIQFIAIAGATLFARLSERKGDIFSLKLVITLWALLCGGAYFVHTAEHFYALGAGVGLMMGGTQALSRAIFAKLIPQDDGALASYFGFYSSIDKTALVIGTLLFGFAAQLFGSMRPAIMGLGFFFVLAFVLTQLIDWKKNPPPVE